MANDKRRVVGALLFPGFELLDMFGPLEMLGVLRDHVEIVTLAETREPVPSAQGPRSVIERDFETAGDLDILLVPGGRGTRWEVTNAATLGFLRAVYPRLEILASICTGSGLLAAAGLLDGRRATSNKKSFAWASSQGPKVDWIPEARWVQDGNVFTAGGVAAGIDMTLALVARLFGEEIAEDVAEYTEYEWHRNSSWDPFAKKAGLV
jgi:transcriptional regulator GlxA family with amidase domain